MMRSIIRFLLIIIFSAFPYISLSQPGNNSGTTHCDSAGSNNFVHPDRAVKSFRHRPRRVVRLSTVLKETSGLVYFNDMLWTMNDGGNPAEIYQLDTTSGKVLRTVEIWNSVNTDWESITQDESSLYIGDIGNNFGSRTDLRILKIAKSDLLNPETKTVNACYIYFRYPDQTDFKPALNQTDFDCEAFFFFNDSLHLFSKDWLDIKTRHYILPVDTGYQQARFVETFHSDGLITDASVNSEGNIVLLGYKNTKGRKWKCFCWLLCGDENNTFFNHGKIRIELGSALRNGQTEGVFINDDNTAWLSAESILVGLLFRPAKLFRMDFRCYFR